MNAVKYYRIKNGFDILSLHKVSGISWATLRSMERMSLRGGFNGISPEHYLKLSEFFGITVDELVRDDLPHLEDIPMHHGRLGSSIEHPDNIIVRYRRQHKLSCRKIAAILDISHEKVRYICARPDTPEKFIRILAAKEGISAEEFYNRYRGANI